MNNKRPHTAVLSIQLEVHSLNDKGECSGQVIHPEVLKNEFDIDSAFLLSISGKNLEECITKLQKLLKDIQDATK